MPLRTPARACSNQARLAPTSLSAEDQVRRRFTELFSAYHRQLAKTIARRLRCPDALAEDACGFAWLQLWRTPPSDRSNVRAWLYVVALHEGFRLLRIQGRELVESPGSEGRERTPLADRIVDPRSPELALEAKQALESLAALKRRQRDTLALQVAGYSYREIQAIRGVSYTNVNRHVSEGRAAARSLREAA